MLNNFFHEPQGHFKSFHMKHPLENQPENDHHMTKMAAMPI